MIRALFPKSLVIALATSLPLAATGETLDPCQEYQLYAQLGEGNMFAPVFERVCAMLGRQKIESDCVDYWSARFDKLAGEAVPDSRLDSYAARCEAAMPGGTRLVTCAEGAPCEALPVPAAIPQTDVGTPGGCGPGLECVEPDLMEEEPCGGEGEPECLAADVAVGAPAPAQAAETTAPPDSALDLAFWTSIQGSDDPALFKAYLDQFPQGTFRPIAEARLAALSAAGSPAPAAAPAPDPAPAATAPAPVLADPQAQLAQAQAILDAAYAQPVERWNAAAAPAVALLQEAAEAGLPGALFALGELEELGIGVGVDNSAAITHFIRAAQGGHPQGYERALMVLDQIGDNTGFVTTFLDAYRHSPDAALAAFDSLSKKGPSWVQEYLRGRNYYTGRIDGDFGRGSRAALDAYIAGAAPPAAAIVPANDTAATLTAALQRELQRLGCYAGPIDGEWGGGSARAMEAFNHWSGGRAPTDRATEAGLAAARATPGQVCGVD